MYKTCFGKLKTEHPRAKYMSHHPRKEMTIVLAVFFYYPTSPSLGFIDVGCLALVAP